MNHRSVKIFYMAKEEKEPKDKKTRKKKLKVYRVM